MSAWLNKLAWDSEFFGFPVFGAHAHDLELLSASEMAQECRREGARLCYVRLDDPRRIPEFASVAPGIVDERIYYTMTLPGSSGTLVDPMCSSYRGPVTQSLLNLAFSAGKFSRFWVDPRIGTQRAQQLYRIWAERSFSGEIADETYLSGDAQDCKGFVTLAQKDCELAEIGLIAVDKGAQRGGVGRSLIGASLAWSQQRGLKRLSVRTQRTNQAACAFYEALGFSAKRIEIIVHWWLT